MDKNFWLKKWEMNEIGFHQAETNKFLVKHIDMFRQIDTNGSSCFVPLCGKSSDLLYLSKYFDEVIGAELAEKAVHDFFKDNNLEHTKDGKNNRFKNLNLINDDLFNITKSSFPTTITHLFDRASLIALPPHLRPKYKKSIQNIISAKTRLMIITIEYDQNRVSGPPFSVPSDEVKNTFPNHNLQLIEDEVTSNLSGKFKGIEVRQKVYLSSH